MKVVLSWLKDYVDIDLSLEELARLLTRIGLEVEEVHSIGLPYPDDSVTGMKSDGHQEFKFNGLAWAPDKIVVAQIDEVMPHPNADRLVLCRLKDGVDEYVVLTGAPNLFEYKGRGPLPQPLKVAYAREGARIYDGHAEGLVLTTLKRAKIRGVESFSMVCSEKELGISEEHEGIMLLPPDAPTGTPLVDYLGDAVYEVSILPNMIRNACMLGVAREIAAALGKPLRKPVHSLPVTGAPLEGQVAIEITDPNLNPRFVLGLVRDVRPMPSPDWVQRRLKLAGMRPINSIVDATNYVMLEIGQPLHAFDYDVLVERAGGKAPTIITRPAAPGEKLTTLDNVERQLDPYTILVTDTAGALSLAGVMGGLESEVTDQTRNVLLEGACWNFINIRRTIGAQRLSSEAAYRFSRGVHPSLSQWGVELGMDRIAGWSGGSIAAGLVDAYPLPAVDPVVEITVEDIHRLLGIDLDLNLAAELLKRLEFTCRMDGNRLLVQTPPHRLDIGTGVTGKADIIEEIARMVGYDQIPATRLSSSLPPQRGNTALEREEKLRDILARLGLQEVITYRLTAPEREERLAPLDGEYMALQNPIAPDRRVMRRSLLAALLEVAERNIRLRERLALFEIGPVFIPQPEGDLPAEPTRLAIFMAGQRDLPAWDGASPTRLDFYDLKGIVEAMLAGLHISGAVYELAVDARFHPGKCASIVVNGSQLGVFGELHPAVQRRWDLGDAPALCADLDADALLACLPDRRETLPVPAYPAILEDIAVIVDEAIPASRVADLIQQTGGKLVVNVRLFDVFRGDQIGSGKKSLAYSLTYQSMEGTLTDRETAQVRNRIVRRLEQELGAKLRGE